MEHLSFGKLSVHHTFVIIGYYLGNDKMVDAFGLQHYPTPFVLPSCTSRHLSHKLESTLIGTKIRIIQHSIGIQNAHYTYMVEVQSLGNHLRTDKNICLSLFKVCNNTLISSTRAGCIQIHTDNGSFGKQKFDVTLYLFRTKTSVTQIRTLTGWADARQLIGISTIMTGQLV